MKSHYFIDEQDLIMLSRAVARHCQKTGQAGTKLNQLEALISVHTVPEFALPIIFYALGKGWIIYDPNTSINNPAFRAGAALPDLIPVKDKGAPLPEGF